MRWVRGWFDSHSEREMRENAIQKYKEHYALVRKGDAVRAPAGAQAGQRVGAAVRVSGQAGTRRCAVPPRQR